MNTTDKEIEELDQVLKEYTYNKVDNMTQKLKVSEEYFENFKTNIPSLAKSRNYKESISDIVNNITAESNKECLAELERYLDETITKKDKNPLLGVWAVMAILFVLQILYVVYC